MSSPTTGRPRSGNVANLAKRSVIDGSGRSSVEFVPVFSFDTNEGFHGVRMIYFLF